jgi:hypothetical protein
MPSGKRLVARWNQETKENDPDTLQILDELDEEWVKSWRKAASKKNSATSTLAIFVNTEKETRPLNQHVQEKT